MNNIIQYVGINKTLKVPSRGFNIARRIKVDAHYIVLKLGKSSCITNVMLFKIMQKVSRK